MNTVAVTGASGHLGANLVRSLLNRGEQVRALVREDRRALAGLDLEMTQGDLTDPASLCRAFDGATTVYHLAAHISLLWNEWARLETINVNGVRNILQACKDCGVHRLVYFSSIHALTQEPYSSPVDEDRPLVESMREPPYNRSKAAGERLVRRAIEAGLDAVIVYPTGVIGPFDYKPSHFGDVLLALGRGRLPASINAGFDWVDARDVAEGAIRAAEAAPAGSRYLLSGKWLSFPEIAQMVTEFTGTPAPRLVVPLRLAEIGAPFAMLFRKKGSRPLYTPVSLQALRGNPLVSHARASRELGYTPRPVETTLRDTLTWFDKMGWFKQ